VAGGTTMADGGWRHVTHVMRGTILSYVCYVLPGIENT
jgi:hypothetical protein